MSLARRIERLEIAQLRRDITRILPASLTVDYFLDHAIQWLEQPLEVRMASMPEFTEAEHRQMPAWLPKYRQARMAGR